MADDTTPENHPAEDDERAVAAEYSRIQRLAELVAQDVLKHIQEVLRGLGDPHFIRAGVDSWRIKTVPSLRRKAQQQNWTFAQAMAKAQDILGFRLVCHNLQDVGRVASLLSDSLANEGLKPRKYDYVSRPKRDGYRSIHLVFRYPAKMASLEAELGCEIQIRSLLQNSWAQLSRADLYAAADEVPGSIIRKMHHLSSQLAKADATADSIRNQFARPRKGRKPTNEQSLSSATLAFIYRQLYGTDPPEYLIQWVLREYKGTGARADGLDAALRDEELQQQLREEYGIHTKWEADNEQLFRWSVHSVAHGREAATRLARRDGREEWKEIERIARNEIMSGYPKDADSLLSRLGNPMKDDDVEWDIEELASGMGGLRTCARCGTRIVDPEELADAVVSHYKLRAKKADKAREDIIDAVRSSAVEVGGWDNPSLCNYCEHVMSKDD
jgi:ppGpp synthetase/RelA/SpoT-type nucleotidyltranferase